MSATTTAVELTSRLHPPHPSPSVIPQTSPDTTSPDAVLDASRLADSTVPDGGYGWVVVFGSSIVVWWTVGTPYSWGVLQAALVSQNLSTPATLSFIGGIAASLISALAILNSRLIRRIGSRPAGMLGVALMGSSEILSSFAVGNLGALFFTAGVMMGLGMSVCFMVITVIPPQYFSRRRGLANGLIFSGGGFGGAAISVGLDAVIRRLGVAWAYRIMGLTTLVTGLPAAWLVKERNRSMRTPGFVEW